MCSQFGCFVCAGVILVLALESGLRYILFLLEQEIRENSLKGLDMHPFKAVTTPQMHVWNQLMS